MERVNIGELICVEKVSGSTLRLNDGEPDAYVLRVVGRQVDGNERYERKFTCDREGMVALISVAIATACANGEGMEVLLAVRQELTKIRGAMN